MTHHKIYKLAPLRFLSLSESRKQKNDVSWGEVGVHIPVHMPGISENTCWAEVRANGSPDYSPVFKPCDKQCRPRHLTCLVHYGRELAARELKCENEGVILTDIAYEDEAAEKAHWKTEKEKRLATRNLTTSNQKP